MRMLAFIEQPEGIAKILTHLGLGPALSWSKGSTPAHSPPSPSPPVLPRAVAAKHIPVSLRRDPVQGTPLPGRRPRRPPFPAHNSPLTPAARPADTPARSERREPGAGPPPRRGRLAGRWRICGPADGVTARAPEKQIPITCSADSRTRRPQCFRRQRRTSYHGLARLPPDRRRTTSFCTSSARHSWARRLMHLKRVRVPRRLLPMPSTGRRLATAGRRRPRCSLI